MQKLNLLTLYIGVLFVSIVLAVLLISLYSYVKNYKKSNLTLKEKFEGYVLKIKNTSKKIKNAVTEFDLSVFLFEKAFHLFVKILGTIEFVKEILSKVIDFVENFKNREKTSFKDKVNFTLTYIYVKFFKEKVDKLDITDSENSPVIKKRSMKENLNAILSHLKKEIDNNEEKYGKNMGKTLLLFVLGILIIMFMTVIETLITYITVTFFYNFTIGGYLASKGYNVHFELLNEISIPIIIFCAILGKLSPKLSLLQKSNIYFEILYVYKDMVGIMYCICRKLKITVLFDKLKVDFALRKVFSILVETFKLLQQTFKSSMNILEAYAGVIFIYVIAIIDYILN